MKKGTLVAIAVFALLLVAAFVSLGRKPERGITRLSLANVDKARIDKLAITGPQPVELLKKGESWQLANGKPADPGAVQTALDTLPRIESGDVSATSSDRFAELEVDDSKGTRVQAFAGAEKLVDVVIGKTGASGVSVRSGDVVYAVRGVSSWVFSKPAAGWMQLKVFTDAVEEATRLEVALAGQAPYALVKNGEDWALEKPEAAPAGFRFDKSLARSLVSSVVNLRAKDLLDKDPGVEATGLKDGADLLAFLGKDGVRRELRIGKALEDKSVYATVAGRNEVISLAEPTARGLRKGIADLREMTLMRFDPAKATRLAIRDGKTELLLEKEGEGWKVSRSSEKAPDDFTLDPAQVTRRLTALSNARALRIAEDASKSGLSKPSASVAITLDDGSTIELAFGEATKDAERDVFFARGNADGEVYLVTRFLHDDVLRGLTSFKPQPGGQGGMPQLDPQQLSQLPPEIRKSLEEQLARQQLMQQSQKQLQLQKMMQKAAEGAAPAAPAPKK